MDFNLSKHTQDMLKEREISEEWVWRTIDKPDWENVGTDNNVHYFKSISEHEGRILHVVVNPHVLPKKVVAVFFDRKARRKK
ncbi:hypothetical protein BMS3Bbin07_00700 [bacterium BMS3Bbin07]|nr:hypothetical protein BMS3Bbin07_00700 [bacterium BMS3Bbin07]